LSDDEIEELLTLCSENKTSDRLISFNSEIGRQIISYCIENDINTLEYRLDNLSKHIHDDELYSLLAVVLEKYYPNDINKCDVFYHILIRENKLFLEDLLSMRNTIEKLNCQEYFRSKEIDTNEGSLFLRNEINIEENIEFLIEFTDDKEISLLNLFNHYILYHRTDEIIKCIKKGKMRFDLKEYNGNDISLFEHIVCIHSDLDPLNHDNFTCTNRALITYFFLHAPEKYSPYCDFSNKHALDEILECQLLERNLEYYFVVNKLYPPEEIYNNGAIMLLLALNDCNEIKCVGDFFNLLDTCQIILSLDQLKQSLKKYGEYFEQYQLSYIKDKLSERLGSQVKEIFEI